jgi:hypothetical protein
MADGEAKAQWRIIPLHEYESPRQPGREVVRGRLTGVWKRLVNKHDSAPGDDVAFGRLSQPWLDKVTPDCDVGAAAEIFSQRIDELRQRKKDRPLRAALVGPPGDCYAEVVAAWGEANGAAIIEAPAPRTLFETGYLFNEIPADETVPLVIPDFAKFYTRNPAGLAALRVFFRWLEEHQRSIVIGCNSWAWAYLVKTIQADAFFRKPLAFAPRSGPELEAWLGTVCSPESGCPWAFRFAWNEVSAFRATDEARGDHSENDEKRDEFFAALAAAARGIPRLELALWRECLRIVQDPGETSGDDSALPAANSDGIIWIQAISTLNLPTIWPKSVRLDGIVLHTILIHSGLAEDVLARLLPFSAPEVTGSLMALERRRLIARRDGIWTITELGYPSVRNFLAGEGFLTGAG